MLLQAASWLCMQVLNQTQREALWQHLKSLRPTIQQPWMMIGDFNEVCTPAETLGGEFHENRALQMISVMDECNLIDLGAIGTRFTWERWHQGERVLAKRLDRAMGDVSWRMLFPEAYVEHLARVYSDHSPLLLRLDADRKSVV